jgi:hypothetical protein
MVWIWDSVGNDLVWLFRISYSSIVGGCEGSIDRGEILRTPTMMLWDLLLVY